MTKLTSLRRIVKRRHKVKMELAIKRGVSLRDSIVEDIVPVEMAHKHHILTDCLLCHAPVYPKCGPVKAPHYAHMQTEENTPCFANIKKTLTVLKSFPESDGHKLAKTYIGVHLKKWEIESRCSRCEKLMSVQTFQEAGQYIAFEYKCGTRFVDVAVLSASGNPVAFIEIFQTHRTDALKQSELETVIGSMNVHELKADEVLSASLSEHTLDRIKIQDIFYKCCQSCQTTINVSLTQKEQRELLQLVWNQARGAVHAREYVHVLDQHIKAKIESEQQEKIAQQKLEKKRVEQERVKQELHMEMQKQRDDTQRLLEAQCAKEKRLKEQKSILQKQQLAAEMEQRKLWELKQMKLQRKREQHLQDQMRKIEHAKFCFRLKGVDIILDEYQKLIDEKNANNQLQIIHIDEQNCMLEFGIGQQTVMLKELAAIVVRFVEAGHELCGAVHVNFTNDNGLNYQPGKMNYYVPVVFRESGSKQRGMFDTTRVLMKDVKDSECIVHD